MCYSRQILRFLTNCPISCIKIHQKPSATMQKFNQFDYDFSGIRNPVQNQISVVPNPAASRMTLAGTTNPYPGRNRVTIAETLNSSAIQIPVKNNPVPFAPRPVPILIHNTKTRPFILKPVQSTGSKPIIVKRLQNSSATASQQPPPRQQNIINLKFQEESPDDDPVVKVKFCKDGYKTGDQHGISNEKNEMEFEDDDNDASRV